MRALSGVPIEDSTPLREKLLSLIGKRELAAPISEEATLHAVRAKSYLEIAQDLSDYRAAASEYEEAVAAAPWWAEAYRDLAYVEERLRQRAPAIRDLKLYLVGNPEGSDADTVRDRIEAIRRELELQN